MASKTVKRKKKIDLKRLPLEQVEALGHDLGKAISVVGKSAAEQVNELVSIYGLKAVIHVQLVDAKTGKVPNF